MLNITRRNILSGSSAVFATSLFPSPIVLKPAFADGRATAAIVVAVIQVAQALASLAQGSNGLGERLLALQITVNAILEIQLATLRAISAVNSNLEALRKEIPELFQLAAYRSSLIETTKAFDA